MRIEGLLTEQRDLFKDLLRETRQEVLEGEMTELLGAPPGGHSSARQGYRAGYYSRGRVTRVGKLERRVPRYQRAEKALVSALAEMYVMGVSTRKVTAITEELCGHSFSASTIREINQSLDAALARFAQRRLTEPYSYLILDARYEKVRLDAALAKAFATDDYTDEING